ncbi:hypothetical protein EDD93_3755 [Streptomyces sp. 840.1]|nr:hypothetical protein EDD93_3755 [Streptomyces sp. 840.1]
MGEVSLFRLWHGHTFGWVRNPGNGAVMKKIKALVRKFKKDEDLANHAWVLHVI